MIPPTAAPVHQKNAIMHHYFQIHLANQLLRGVSNTRGTGIIIISACHVL